LMMSLWDALRMNMMISYQELVRTFPSTPSFIENEGFEEINPASGLEMCGATDIAGNLYGMSNYP
ncbi:hypothetical protein ACQE9L_26735, partial [Klebsiella pneumoniae]